MNRSATRFAGMIVAALLLSACQAVPPEGTEAATSTATPSIAAETASTAPSTRTSVPQPTPTRVPDRSTESPAAIYQNEITVNARQGLDPVGEMVPDGALNRIGQGMFRDVVVSPGGTYVLVTSTIGISLHLVENFVELWSRAVDTHAARFSPDGRWVSVLNGGELYVLDIQTGETALTLSSGEENYIGAYDWSPSGDQIVSLQRSESDPFNSDTFNTPHELIVWNAETGSVVWSKDIIQNQPQGVDWSPKGDLILYSTGDWSRDTFVAVDAASGHELYRFDPSVDPLHASAAGVRFSPSGDLIALAYGWFVSDAPNPGQFISIWDAETGARVQTIQSPVRLISMRWHNDLLIPAYYSHYLPDDLETQVTFPVFAAKSDSLAYAIADTESFAYREHRAEWSPAGTRIADITSRGSLTVWDVASGDVVFDAASIGNKVAWTKDDCCVITFDESQLTLWDIDAGEARYQIYRNGVVYKLDFSPDGSSLAIASNHNEYTNSFVDIYDVDMGQIVTSIATEGKTSWFQTALSLEYSPNGEQLALVANGFRPVGYGLQIWDVGSWNTRYVVPPPSTTDPKWLNRLWTATWLSDISIALNAAEVYELDIETDTRTEISDSIGTLTVRSPQGNYLAVSNDNAYSSDPPISELIILDLHLQEPVIEIEVPGNHILTACFSADEKQIVVSTDYSETLLGWDIETGQQTYELTLLSDNLWLDGVSDVIWSPSGSWMAVAYGTPPLAMNSNGFTWEVRDGLIVIWDSHTGDPLRIFNGHNGAAQDIDLSPDGTILASASADGTVILWDVSDLP